MSLIRAVEDGDLKLVKQLIAADPNIVGELDENGLSALHWAANSNRADIAKVLIDNKADINLKDNEGWTPLYVACVADSMEVGLLLLDRGAAPNILSNTGESPIFGAADHLNKTLINKLIECNADLNIVRPLDKVTVLHVASGAETNHPHAKLLLAVQLWGAGAQITKDVHNLEPYHYLANHDRYYAEEFRKMISEKLGESSALVTHND